MEPADLKQRITALLNDGKEILIRWYSGGDERFLYAFIDGKELEYNDDFAVSLERLIVNLLSLHSSGEPHINGEGRLSIEEGAIVLTHSSECYEEEWDDEQNEWIKIDREPLGGKQILMAL